MAVKYAPIRVCSATDVGKTNGVFFRISVFMLGIV